MPHLIRRLTLAISLMVLMGAIPASAQSGNRGRQPDTIGPRLISRLDQRRAEEVRNEFRELLGQYPPALARVFKLDATLMTNEPYLAPYPNVAAFLNDHPEVSRYPEYFLDFVREENVRPFDAAYETKSQTIRMWENSMMGSLVLLGFVAATLTISWIIRYIVSHRRWLRATKVQTDIHTRLLERFGSSEELMTYLQSPVGRNYLGTLPSAADVPAVSGTTAPLGRILWSVQAGLVLASAGAGFLLLKHYVLPEVADMMLVFGILAVSVGIGFALAAAASYMLSHRLGLFEAPAGRSDGAGRA